MPAGQQHSALVCLPQGEAVRQFPLSWAYAAITGANSEEAPTIMPIIQLPDRALLGDAKPLSLRKNDVRVAIGIPLF